MYAYKDLLELAGLTTRVYTLISTLHALPPVRDFVVDENQIALDGVSICVPERSVRSGSEKAAEILFDEEFDKLGLGGTDGSLMDPLKLVVKRGEHLMITGPVRVCFLSVITRHADRLSRPQNGVGKTAIARVLAGLWEAVGGQLRRPSRGVKGLFVVPQRAYMVVGTLRDQLRLYSLLLLTCMGINLNLFQNHLPTHVYAIPQGWWHR